MRETDPRNRVAGGMVTAEELRNVATGLRRIYPVAEDSAFDDILVALERASRNKSTRGSNRI